MRRLKLLEDENSRLKKIVADLTLELASVALSRRQQRTQLLASARFHMNGLEPARSDQLGDRPGVFAVILVLIHRDHGCLRMARLRANPHEISRRRLQRPERASLSR